MSFHFSTLNPFYKLSLSLIIFLISATAISGVAPFSAKLKKELLDRIKTWWVILGLIIGVLFLPQVVEILFFAAISTIALREYLTLIPTRASDKRAILWAYLAIPVQYLLVYRGWYGMFIIFIPVYMFLILSMRLIIIGETKGFLTSVSELHWGLMINVFSLSHVAYLAKLQLKTDPVGGMRSLILLLIILTELNDVFQYVCGKTFGKHKIVPTVSPNKTWEGFLGGVILTTLLSSVLTPAVSPIHGGMAVLLGFLLAIVGFFGDTTFSAVKRDVGVKDSGHLLPGHGGILDRVDSLSFTSLVFFHFVRYFYT